MVTVIINGKVEQNLIFGIILMLFITITTVNLENK
jgi:hypothetical protein